MKIILTQLHRAATGSDQLGHALAQLEGLRSEELAPDDIVVLPELVCDQATDDSFHQYQDRMSDYARQLNCHIVAGSGLKLRNDGGVRNAGIVCDATGAVRAHYEKTKLYSAERDRVESGIGPQDLIINGLRARIFICADFFYSDFFRQPVPDILLIAALSASRKTSPHYSQSLWRHTAISRAYETGAFVGISDWAFNPEKRPTASGVAGFADPTTDDPTRFFSSVGEDPWAVFRVDLAALQAVRRDREAQGFLNHTTPEQAIHATFP